ncbi:MAG TPA: nitrate reductase cytochrome c-type subunit [Geminicoccaceae bacterium]
MIIRTLFLAVALAAAAAAALAQEPVGRDWVATMRLDALTEEGEAPRMPEVENRDLRRVRNYPEQPPTIPHKIDGYQIDMNFNKCLDCHSRSATGESQAPMVSITHFMDRDGQFLAAVSPRRYFCNQCHVVQHETEAPVENTFEDIDTLLEREAAGGQD